MGEDGISKFIDGCLEHVVWQFTYLGCLYSGLKSSHELATEIYQSIFTPLRDIIARTQRLALRWREQVVTVDYGARYPSGLAFDTRTMVLDYPSNNLPKGDLVVLVTQLGLEIKSKPSRERAEIQTKVLKKAKVITMSMMMELVSPSKE